MSNEVGPLIFPNVVKLILPHLKQHLPPSVYVSSVVPKVRRPEMAILRIVSGSELGDIRASVVVNILVWAETWERSLDLSLEVDARMRMLNDGLGTGIISCKSNILPIPSGDGESVEVPVYSSSYSLIVNAENL